MGIYYSIFSKREKEYIECIDCGWKNGPMIKPGHCCGPLLLFLCINGTWLGDEIEVIGDYLKLPWEDDDTWMDVTKQSLEKYLKHTGIDLHGHLKKTAKSV